MPTKLNLYPALIANMGEWKYYITMMRIADIANEIGFASEFGADQSQVDVLGQARQRVLDDKRAKKQITDFLRKDYRFFSSLVVAAIEGNPEFFPVDVSGDSVGGVFKGSGIDESFGVLRFDASLKLYALDGQHRLMAIKHLLESDNIPQGFEDEKMCVIMVIRRESEVEIYNRDYRRLFTSLNRHAQKTKNYTNIILDEDDVYAILTRRLISEHEFFRDKDNKESKSIKVKIDKSNLVASDSHFTTLETLYNMVKTLLLTNHRQSDPEWKKINKAARPDEGKLDDLYKELSNYWQSILLAMPDLKKNPQDMRNEKHHLFFRPIGQKMMASLVRFMLNEEFDDSSRQSVDKMKNALSPLGKIDWSIQSYPWRRIASTPKEEGSNEYTMRSETRTVAMQVALEIAQRMVSNEPIDENKLKENWVASLSPAFNEDKEKSLWEQSIQSKFKK